MNENVNSQYCIVKYFHYEVTDKHLECKNCVMDCKYKKSIGGSTDDKSTD